jgi:hypothetical protein
MSSHSDAYASFAVLKAQPPFEGALARRRYANRYTATFRSRAAFASLRSAATPPLFAV